MINSLIILMMISIIALPSCGVFSEHHFRADAGQTMGDYDTEDGGSVFDERGKWFSLGWTGVIPGDAHPAYQTQEKIDRLTEELVYSQEALRCAIEKLRLKEGR